MTGLPLQPGVVASARFSSDGRYRYTLRRTWDAELPWMTWIMLNPSVASEDVDDPTVAKCQRYARAFGYGGILVLNIFAYRATKPVDMKAAPWPEGPNNMETITGNAMLSPGVVVAAWGTGGAHRAQGAKVTQVLSTLRRDIWCLAKSKGGHPVHPLYQPEEGVTKSDLVLYRAG